MMTTLAKMSSPDTATAHWIWHQNYSELGNTVGYPGVFQGNLHLYPLVPLPVNLRVFWSKQVQKHDFWTRNEGDITDLFKSVISCYTFEYPKI